MSAETTAADRYCFGDYELRVHSRELLRRGDAVPLEPKVFDLLVTLVRHHDRVVSKDELLATVWPGTFVSETAMTRCVMKARKALGDDSEQQHSIKTSHGRGYRFVAPLIEAVVPAPTKADGANQGAATARRSRLPLVATALGAMALGAGLLWTVVLPMMSAPPSADGHLPRIAVLPVVNESQDENLDWMAYGLMDLLAKQLQSYGGLQVASSRDVIRALGSDERVTPERVPATGIAARLASRLGTSHVLVAALTRPGQLYQLRARLYTGVDLAREFELVGAEPISLVTELRRRVSAQLVGSVGVSEVARVVSSNALVNERYARGRDLMLRSRLDEAAAWLEAALEGEPDNFWVRHALANTRLNQGQAEEAAERLTVLAGDAHAAGEPLHEALAIYTLGTTRLRRQRLDEARAHYERALAIFDALNLPYEQARTLTNLAIVIGEQHDLQHERALLERAARAFELAGLDRTPAHVLGGLGNNALDLGDLAQAQAYYREGLEGFRNEGRQDQVAVAYVSLSRVAEYRGDFDAALTLADQSLAVAQEIGHAWAESSAWRRRAVALAAAGEFAAAEAAHREALAKSRALDAKSSQGAALADLGDLARRQGRLAEATALLAQSREIVDAIGDPTGALVLRHYDGELALARGDISQALALAAQALEEGDALPRFAVLNAHELRAHALLTRGDMEDALSAFEAAYAVAQRRSDRVRRAQLVAQIGALQLRLGEPAKALASLSLAREAVDGHFQVLALEGAVAAQEGEGQRAMALLDAAKARAKARWTAADEAWRVSVLDGSRVAGADVE